MPAKYRADHIGSLLRPAELLQARSANLTPRNCARSRTSTSCESSRRQKELGFKIFTDGELRRGNFMSDFNDAVEGIDEGVAVARLGKRRPARRPVLRWCPARSSPRSNRSGV